MGITKNAWWSRVLSHLQRGGLTQLGYLHWLMLKHLQLIFYDLFKQPGLKKKKKKGALIQSYSQNEGFDLF